jgi:hypothetical protein
VPSPIGAFLLSRPGRFGFPKVALYYWISMATQTALTGGMLAWACWALPRSWQQRQVVTAKQSRTAARESALRRWTNVVGAMNPYRWLATRERFPKRLARGLFVLITLVWLGCYLGAFSGLPRIRDEFFVTCFLIAFGLHLIVKGMIAMQASRRLCEERRSGALELLLISPLEPWSILDGQRAALRRQFGWLLGLLTAMNFLMILPIATGSLNMPADVRFTFTLMMLGGAVLLFVDFNALGWVGMRAALDGRRHHRTVMSTLGRVMLLPWGAVFIFITLGFAGGIDGDSIAGLFITWAVLSIVLARAMAVRARRDLTGDMRRLVSGDGLTRANPARQVVRAVESDGPKSA